MTHAGGSTFGEPLHPVEVETVDLTGSDQPRSLSEYAKTFDPAEHKAQSATLVAKVIVWTFTGTIAGALVLAITILLISPNVDEAQKYAAVMVSMFDGLSNFLTAVFAPLLAFVLGYYFGEKSGEK